MQWDEFGERILLSHNTEGGTGMLQRVRSRRVKSADLKYNWRYTYAIQTAAKFDQAPDLLSKSNCMSEPCDD
jgi:hypothetical protein